MAKLEEFIEFRHLRYFIAAVEQGSFRKAGTAIGVRESSVSRGVKQLEDFIGTSLFQRHIGGVSLTAAGSRFLPDAREAVRKVRESAKMAASTERVGGWISVGIVSSLATGFIATLLRDFGQYHADVMLTFVEGEANEHVGAIRQMNLDVAFIAGNGPWPNCQSSALWKERVMVAVPNRHRLASFETIEWRDLADENIIMTGYNSGSCKSKNIPCHLPHFSTSQKFNLHSASRDNLLALVALGQGIFIVYEAASATDIPGVTYRPIATESVIFNAVWSPHNANPALSQMLRLAKSLSGTDFASR